MRQAGGRAVLLAMGALVAAAVAACGGGQTASGSASVPTTVPTQPSAAASPPAQGQPAAENTPQGGGTCHSADLTAKLGNKTKVPVDVQGQLGAAGTHYSLSLVWTNKSGHTCTMHGFGGVDIDGPNQGSTGAATYSLPRTADNPTTVSLAPGASAHTTINYIDPSGSQPDGPMWTPTHLEVTPPNETNHISVPWTAGTPVYQDPQDGSAAASISPITSGA